MYDTVTIWVNTSDTDSIVSVISEGKEYTNRTTGETFILGKIENLKVKIYEKRSVRIEGTLPKFFYGVNCYTLKIPDISLAIEKLSDCTSLYISDGIIRRLDVGVSIELIHPVSLYIMRFGELSRYSRSLFGNVGSQTVAYKNGSLSFKAYDKIAEMGKNTPVELSESNLIRLELSATSAKKTFSDNQFVNVALLTDPYFHEKCLRKLGIIYSSIIKNKQYIPNDYELRNQTDLSKLILTSALQIDDFYDQYSTLIQLSEMNQTQKTRCRKLIRDCRANPKFTDQSPLIKELDEKINNRKFLYLT